MKHRFRESIIEHQTMLGSVGYGSTRGQMYITLKSQKSIKPYDTATAQALYTDQPSPSASGNPHWEADCLNYFLNSTGVISEYILSQETGSGSSLSYQGTLQDDRKIIRDISTPGYAKRSAQGEVFNNPLTTVHTKFAGGVTSLREQPKPTITLEVVYGTAGSVTGRDMGYLNSQGNMVYFTMWKMLVRYTIDFAASSNVVAPTSALTYLDKLPFNPISHQNALNTAYGNINAASLELLTMVAEGKSTISHLVSVVARLAKLIGNIRRGNIASIAPKTWKKFKSGSFGASTLVTSPKVAGDAWLEARYAWTPLVLDAVAAVSLLSGTDRSDRMTFRGKDSDSTSRDISYMWTEGGLRFSLTGLLTEDHTVRVGHLCESRFDSPLAADLGLFNIVGTIKELIPWSFVVEWFVNLSGFIYRLNPSPAYVILASWATVNSAMDFHGQIEVTAPDGSKKVVPLRYTRTQKDRKPIDSPADITLDVYLNTSRLIDATAFLRRVGR